MQGVGESRLRSQGQGQSRVRWFWRNLYRNPVQNKVVLCFAIDRKLSWHRDRFASLKILTVLERRKASNVAARRFGKVPQVSSNSGARLDYIGVSLDAMQKLVSVSKE